MKYYFLLFCFWGFINAHSQSINQSDTDIIVLKNNNVLKVKIIEIGNLVISYSTYKDNTLKSLYKRDILMIRHHSQGLIEFGKENQSQNLLKGDKKFKTLIETSFGYGIRIFGDHLYNNIEGDTAGNIYSGNYDSYGRGNIFKMGIKLQYMNRIEIGCYAIKANSIKFTQSQIITNSSYIYEQKITRYFKSTGLALIIGSGTKRLKCGIGVLYYPNLIFHEDSLWNFKDRQSSNNDSRVETTGQYSKPHGTLGICFTAKWTFKLSKHLFLESGLETYNINFRPSQYITTNRQTINFSNTNNNFSKIFSNNSKNSGDITPVYRLNSVNISIGLSFYLF